jgi:tRNA(Ile)-lysidine synthase
MFAPGQRVGVAVSGGADSVCLLHVLVELAPRWDLQLSVLHLDHQLRGAESAADAEFVRQLAASLGLELHLRRADVKAMATADNLEQAARRARREFFLEFLRAGRLDRVAVGHTRSDQAETVLFRFLRGSGTTGLAGIWPATPEGLVRPLIEVDRREVIEYLRQRSLAWREDSSNEDRSFARNRIRHELLPALARDWNPGLTETLAQTAILAREDEQYWSGEIGRLAASGLRTWCGSVLLRASGLSQLPPAVERRLVRVALAQARGDLRGVDFVHVEQVMRLARRPGGHGRAQVPGLAVARSFDWIRLAPAPEQPPAGYKLPLAVPGRYLIPGTEVEISLELGGTETGYNTVGSNLDWNEVSGPVELRNWRPGDRYRPAGHASPVKLKRLFQRARVPLWVRRSWPIITRGEVIVWASGFGPSADHLAGPGSRTVLRVLQNGDLASFWRS